MANDSAEFKALTKETDETSSSLIDEVINHTKETWKDVTTGNASTSQYAEAAVEALTVTTVGAFLYTRNRGLANSFAHNIDSSLQFTDDVANPGLLAQIRAASKNGETLPGMTGKPGTFSPHSTEEFSGLPNEAHNHTLLAQIKEAANAGKGTEQAGLSQILVHPDTGKPLLAPLKTKPSRIEELTTGLPAEINFGDEAGNQLLAATVKKLASSGRDHHHVTPEIKFSDVTEKWGFPHNSDLPQADNMGKITSIVKRNLE